MGKLQCLVTVVSSHTVDVFPGMNGQLGREVPGGPARYIVEALTRLGCQSQVITGGLVRVEVVPTSSGEEYVIPPVAPIELPESLPGDAVILSPVMEEINPSNLSTVSGLLVVDLQGFVRQPNRQSGQVNASFELSGLLRRASVVKASSREIELLSEASKDALQSSILVVTHGSEGAVIQSPDGQWEIAARPVPASNTVGAGDTFLAAFVYELLQRKSPPRAGEAAARFTESLLQERVPAG